MRKLKNTTRNMVLMMKMMIMTGKMWMTKVTYSTRKQKNRNQNRRDDLLSIDLEVIDIRHLSQ
jgi:hypothetical protein